MSAWNYFKIGVAYKKLGQLDQAHTFLDSAINLAGKQGRLETLSNSFFFKSLVLLEEKKFEQAYHILDSSYIYHLEYDTAAFRNQAKGIELDFTKNKYDRQVSNLTFTIEANEQIMRQRQVIMIVLGVSALLILIISILLVRRRKMSLQLREAQLTQQLLRTQMEPHFIFNSLGILQSYIRGGDISKSINYLSQYSRLLRLVLENARHSFVLLHSEITALESYLKIQSEQLDQPFNYSIKIYPGFENDNILVPPMLIQPFVENAIMHGFANLTEKGNITISIDRQADLLTCIIEDNGVGLNSATKDNAKRSLSLAITKERLELLGRQTGKRSTLDITDKQQTGEGNGVRVKLVIPFRTNAG